MSGVHVALWVRLDAKPGQGEGSRRFSASELLAKPPVIEKIDVLAAKLPE